MNMRARRQELLQHRFAVTIGAESVKVVAGVSERTLNAVSVGHVVEVDRGLEAPVAEAETCRHGKWNRRQRVDGGAERLQVNRLGHAEGPAKYGG